MWAQIRNSQLYTINTHRCYCFIDLLNMFCNCDTNTWVYGLCHIAYVHTLQVCILLTAYRIQLFKQMTQTAHSRAYWCKNRSVYRELCVFVGLCLCLCLSSNNETRKNCGRSGTDGVICFEMMGSSSGMNKPAHWRNAWFVLGNDFFGWWTEKQWDR